MKAPEFPEAKGIVMCGDIHGEFNELVFKCCVQYGMTDTVVIVAGDSGFGFERQGYYENIYNRNRGRLSKANNWLLMLRGNHDNPAYFNERPITHQRFMTLPDYSIVQACGHTVLCVGGAVSVDRSYRLNSDRYHLPKADEPLAPNVYWKDEPPLFDMEKLNAISGDYSIDTVVTHTAPSFCELTTKQGLENWVMKDEDLLEQVKKERQTMDDLHHYLKAKSHPLRHWFYGHFHQSWHQEIDGVQYNMLDIMELRELRGV